ncbi:YmfQ family protein [Oscillibacter hominis]|uniref:YmfQ family protein n=1 Tax=Oscillibacter hominis TaxID=2763056 RepID=A0A7G9B826_9FIRM|nr:putative phage tail protein [Oscillibacter hominis]QNL45707.1 YmfQ family protein [Oscillibacter hominis]
MSDLMVKLPPCYQNSAQVRELQRVMGEMTGAAGESVEELLLQLNPRTASGWGLSMWEEAYGVPVDLSRPEEYRRSRLLSKVRGQGAATCELIRSVAESFTNGEVEIVEHNSEFYFVVKFVSRLGVPPNIDDLRSAISEIKPAHLDFIFEYLYRTWGEVKPLTWGQAKTHTWGEIREGEWND